MNSQKCIRCTTRYYQPALLVAGHCKSCAAEVITNLQAENATHKDEKALFFNEIDRLKADNANLKRLCRECYRFYESIGSVLDGDHIRKAWHGSSTKAEIEQVLKE